jgi:hypothetical protein
MEQPTKIEGFALCASPFSAPVVLALFGLAFSWGSSSAGFFSILFWQIVLAFEYSLLYLGVSLPIAWLLWRFFPSFCSSQRSIHAPLLVAVAVFAVSANARAFGILSVGPLEPETFSFILGVTLNAIAFVWLSRRALTRRSTSLLSVAGRCAIKPRSAG